MTRTFHAEKRSANGQSKRSSNWIKGIARESCGRGAEILDALGISGASDILEKRKFTFPGGEKPKARIFDPEKGAGVDDESGRKWSDWVGLAKEVRGDTTMAQAAEFVRDVIGGNGSSSRNPTPRPIEKRAKQKRSTDTRNLLKPIPFNGVFASNFLRQLDLDPRKASKLRDAGIGFGIYNGSHPVVVVPAWGPDGSAADPINIAIARIDGRKWKLGDDRPRFRTIGGSARGIIGNVCQIDQLIDGSLPAGLSIKVEGISDWLALLLRDDLPAGAVAWTNQHGARDHRGTWDESRWFFDAFRDHETWVIGDADTAGQEGAVAWCQRFAQAGASVKNLQLQDEVVAKKGRDLRDFFAGCGTFADVESIAAKTETIEPSEGGEADTDEDREGNDDRPTVYWSDNEKHLVKDTIEALFSADNLFQRGAQLYDVVEAEHPISADEKILRIRRLPKPQLRTIITDRAIFKNRGKDEDEDSPRSITNDIVSQVASFANYPSIRELHSVSEFPFLRPDGSVCSRIGYDPATKTYLRTNLKIDIPETPTKDDAVKSAERIYKLIADFEFQKDHHRSGWLAGLLTVFAKPAISGCVPLFIIEASVQGSGKTRLVDLISMIAMGRPMVRNAWPSKDEEVSKSITSIVLSGIPMVLYDNVRTCLGGQAIEAVGTAQTWKSRILGESRESSELPIRQTFFFTGNNATVSEDVARRGCFVRLEPTVENPDLRDDFSIPDLLGHTRQLRPQIVVDVLTILRAFVLSDEKENLSLKTMGGFEEWSKLIRGAIVWLGLSDPIQGTIDVKESTTAGDVFPELLEAMVTAGLTEFSAREVCETAASMNGYGEFVHSELRDSLLSACGDRPLTAQRVGKFFQKYDGRFIRERKFFSKMDRRKRKVWFITDNAGSEGSCGSDRGHKRSEESEVVESTEGARVATMPNTPATPFTPGGQCSPNCSKQDLVRTKNGGIAHEKLTVDRS